MPPPTTESLQGKLLDLLAGIDFGRRYYAYYERCRGRGKMPAYGREDLEAALATVPLGFTYQRREDFFRHQEVAGPGLTLALNVAFPASTAELILDVRTPTARLGDPYKLLAREIERRRDPAFSFSPPYPDLPFSNADELREVIAFGVGLYAEAREAILAAGDWGA
jgi:hypothetical protein